MLTSCAGAGELASRSQIDRALQWPCKYALCTIFPAPYWTRPLLPVCLLSVVLDAEASQLPGSLLVGEQLPSQPEMGCIFSSLHFRSLLSYLTSRHPTAFAQHTFIHSHSFTQSSARPTSGHHRPNFLGFGLKQQQHDTSTPPQHQLSCPHYNHRPMFSSKHT